MIKSLYRNFSVNFPFHRYEQVSKWGFFRQPWNHLLKGSTSVICCPHVITPMGVSTNDLGLR